MPMMNWNHTSTLKNEEVRFQKRYLDFICNPDSKDVFKTRAKVIQAL